MTLISRRLLNNPGFVKDLRSLLTLPAPALTALSDLVNDEMGFGESKAQLLDSRFSLSPGQATGSVKVARYLYDRVTTLELTPQDAVKSFTRGGLRARTPSASRA